MAGGNTHQTQSGDIKRAHATAGSAKSPTDETLVTFALNEKPSRKDKKKP